MILKTPLSFAQKSARLLIAIIAAGTMAVAQGPTSGPAKAAPPSGAQARMMMAGLPLAFEANQGQSAPEVRFLARGNGYTMFLTGNEAVLALESTGKDGKPATEYVRLKIDGSAKSARFEGEEQLVTRTSYFFGDDAKQWRTNIANFGRVRSSGVYPGIDLVYYGNQQHLEHDFVVKPGADPRQIAMDISGAKRLRLTPSGDLSIQTARGELLLRKPVLYQVDDKTGGRHPVAGSYQLAKNRVRFNVGDYDRSRELVIDPVLIYGTYVSGTGTVNINAIAVDSSSNVYVTGSSSTTSFPPATTTTCATCVGGSGLGAGDVFVAKLNSTGTSLTYLSFLGGTASDVAKAIALDSSNNVYITGQTSSTGAGKYPTTTGARQTAASTVPDAFVSVLNTTGTALTYSTYLGGTASDDGRAIGVGSNNGRLEIFVAGSTASTDFPVTSATDFQNTNGGGSSDGWVVRLNPAGGGAADEIYGTYFGGGGTENINGMAVLGTSTETGVVVFGGSTTSNASFPSATGGAQTSRDGATDGFVTKLDTGLRITAIACLDTSPNKGIQVTTALPHNLAAGNSVAISGVASAAGPNSTVTFSNNAVSVSATGLTTNSFFYTDNSCDTNGTTNGTVTDSSFVTRSTTIRNTFLGGDIGTTNSAVTVVNAIAVDGVSTDPVANGRVYVVGNTNADTANAASGFPDTANNLIQNGQSNDAGVTSSQDAFLAEISANLSSVDYSTYIGGGGTETGTAVAVDPTCTAGGGCEVYVGGTTASANFPQINAYQSALSGTQDGFVMRVTAAGASRVYATYLGGNGNADSVTGVAVNFSSPDVAYIAGSTDSTNQQVTASSFQTLRASANTQGYVSKLAANAGTDPVFTLVGSNGGTDPIGQKNAFASSVTYTWTIGNTNAATNVVLDIPTPQTSGTDELVLGTITPSVGSCTSRAGTATQPGGITCAFGNLAAAAGATLTVAAQPATALACNAAGACPVTTVTLAGKVAAAEAPSANNPKTAQIVSNVKPVVTLSISAITPQTFIAGSANNAFNSITITNSGASDASNVTTVVTLDPAFTNTTTGSAGCAVTHPVASDVVTCTAATIGNTNGTFTFSFNSDAPASPGTLNSSVSVSNTSTPKDFVNTTGLPVTANFTTDIILNADLQPSFGAPSPATVTITGAGSQITYPVTITNNVGSTVPTAIVDITFAQGFVNVSDTSANGCSVQSPTVLRCDAGPVAVGVPAVFNVVVSPASTSVPANQASINNFSASATVNAAVSGYTDTVPGNNTANATNVTVQRTVDLQLTTVAVDNPAGVPTPKPINNGITYTGTIQNNGPDDATTTQVKLALSTTLADTDFTGVTVKTASLVNLDPLGCSAPVTTPPSAPGAADSTAVLVCNVKITAGSNSSGSLTVADGARNFTFVINLPNGVVPPGSNENNLVNTTVTLQAAAVNTPGGGNTANTTSDVRREVDLSFTAFSASPTTINSAGAPTSTTISGTVKNASGKDTAQNYSFTVTGLPANFTLGAVTGCDSTTGTNTAGGSFKCNFAATTLAGNGNQNFTFVVTPPTSFPNGFVSKNFTATAALTSTPDNFETDNTNDTTNPAPGDVTVTVNASADLDITTTPASTSATALTPASLTQTITLSLHVTNNGPNSAINPRVTISGLGNNYTYVGDSLGNTCVPTTATGTAICDLTTPMANGSTVNFTFDFVAPATLVAATSAFATLSSSAAVTAPAGTSDPTAGNNNTGTITSRVERQTQLSLANFTNSPATIASNTASASSNETLNVDISNAGGAADAATHATVVFTLDANFSFQNATNATCTITSTTTLSCDAGALAPGNTVTVTAVVRPSATAVAAGSATGTFTISTASVSVPAQTASIDQAGGTKTLGPTLATVTVQRQVDFRLTSFAVDNPVGTPKSIASGTTYSGIVQNNGPDDANNVRLKFDFTTTTGGTDFTGITVRGVSLLNLVSASCVVTSNPPSGPAATDSTASITCNFKNGANTTGALTVADGAVSFVFAVNLPNGIVPAGINENNGINTKVTLQSATVVNTPGGFDNDNKNSDVRRQVDLNFSVFGPASQTVNSTTFATIGGTVRNSAADRAQNFSFTISGLPAGYTLGTVTGCDSTTGTNTAAGTFQCNYAATTIAGGGTSPFTLQVTPPAGFVPFGSVNQQYTAAGTTAAGTDNFDIANGNNTSTNAVVTVNAVSDLGISSFTTAVSPVSQDGTITLNVTVRNFGPDGAVAPKVSFSGLGANYRSPANVGCSVFASNTVAGTAQCTLADMASGSSTSFSISFQAPATPTFIPATSPSANISASASTSASTVDTNAANDSAGPVTTVAERQTNLSISAFTVLPDPSNINGNVTVSLNVANLGGADPATHASVTFTLTSGYVFTGTATNATCVATSATLLTCDAGALAAGANITISAVVKPAPGSVLPDNLNGSFSVSADVSAPQSAAADQPGGVKSIGATAISVQRQANLGVVFTAPAGGTTVSSTGVTSQITYTASVSNAAGLDDATNVVVLFTFPSAIGSIVSTTAAGTANVLNGTLTGFGFTAPLSGCVADAPKTHVACAVGGVVTNTPGSSFNLVVTPAAGIVPTNLVNTSFAASAAVSSASTADPTPGNDSANANAVTVERRSNLAIAGNANPATVNLTGTLTYTLTISNLGPDDATNVQVVDALPNSGPNIYTLTLANPSQGVCNGTTTVTCDLGTIANGGSATITITGTSAIDPNLSSVAFSHTPTVATSPVSINDPVAGNNNILISSTVRRQADVSVGVVATPDPSGTNNPLTYTVTVTNFGPDPATNIQVVDNFQNSSPNIYTPTTITPSQGSCNAPTASSVTCPLGTIASGGTATVVLVGSSAINPAATQVNFSNNGVVSASPASIVDLNSGNDSITISNSVGRSADLTITQVAVTPTPGGATTVVPQPGGSGGVFTVTQNTTIVYDVTVQNNGPDDATNVVVTETLPTTLQNSATGTGCGTFNYNSGTRVITCTIGNLANGASTVVRFTVTPLSPAGATATVTTTPSVTTSPTSSADPDNTNNGLQTDVLVQRATDLGVTITDPGVPIIVGPTLGQNVTYTLTAINNGPSDATNVLVTDALPAGMNFFSASAGCSNAGGTVTCNFGTLLTGTQAQKTITVTPTTVALANVLSSQVVNNSAQISSVSIVDNTGGNNNATVSTTLYGESDVRVTVTHVPVPQNANAPAGQVLAGDQVTYTVTVNNAGPHAAENINVVNTLPAGVALSSVNAPSFTSCVAQDCNLAALAAGGSASYTFTVNVPPAAVTTNSTNLNSSTTVSTFNPPDVPPPSPTDPVLANNTANYTVIARQAADTGVTQIVNAFPGSNPPSILFNTSGGFTMTISNANGRSNATNVVLTNTLNIQPGASVTSVNSTPSQGTCNPLSGGVVTCNLGTIAPGASATVTLVMTPTQSGSVANTPSVVSAEIDPATPNNSAAIGTIIVNNTPPTSPAVFNPTDSSTLQPDPTIVITLKSVTVGGITTVTKATSGVPIPGYIPGSTGFLYNTITSTADFSHLLPNDVVMCFDYTGTTFIRPERVRLIAINQFGTATDITIGAGWVPGKIICGDTNSVQFSNTSPPLTFTIQEPQNRPPVAGGTASVTTSTGSKGAAGAQVSLNANLNMDPDNNACTLPIPGQPGQFSALNTCSDNSNLTITWLGNFVDGVQKTFSCTSLGYPACLTQLANATFGSQTLTLIVTDPLGLSSQFPVTLTATGGTSSTLFPSNAKVTGGQTATFAINLGFTGSATPTVLQFVGTPDLAANKITCVSQPAALLAPATSTTVFLLCSTTGPVFAKAEPGPKTGGADTSTLAAAFTLSGLPLVGMVLIPVRSRRQKKLRVLAMIGLVLLLTVFMAACGGGGGGSSFGGGPKLVSAGTPPGTYTINVVPTAGVTVQGVDPTLPISTGNPASAPVTITVQ